MKLQKPSDKNGIMIVTRVSRLAYLTLVIETYFNQRNQGLIEVYKY